MSKSGLYKTIPLCIRLLIGIIFMISGLTKLIETNTFAATIRSFGVTFGFLPNILSFVIPLLELIFGAMLLLGYRIRFSSYVIGSILLIFIAAIIPILTVGETVECGCFGSFLESNVDFSLLARDTILLMGTFYMTITKNHIFSIDNLINKRKTAQ